MSILAIGTRIGKLVVVGDSPRRGAYRMYHCRCDCGNERIVYAHMLTSKTRPTKSCGCLTFDIASLPRCTTHALSRHAAYWTWSGMMARCYKRGHHSYKYYGARGITVCSRWHDVTKFVEDMGEPPDGMTLDRIDNNGNYEPSNCKWSSSVEQHRNKSTSQLLTLNGVTMCQSAWAERTGMSRSIINKRVRAGWSVERTLTERPQVKRPQAKRVLDEEFARRKR